MLVQQRILRFVIRCNWIIFAVLCLVGIYALPFRQTAGIVAGGLIATINFHLLYRTLKKSFTPPHVASHRVILLKYYIRFTVSGFIIFMLISRGTVAPAGLIIGLSVVVASIIFATIIEATRFIISKEAT